MSYTKRIYVGNVVKDPHGYLWIVSKTTDTIIEAVSFDAPNSSGCFRLDTHTRTETCGCDYNGHFTYDEGCEQCHGTGRIEMEIKGWQDHAEVLAPSVQAFILNNVKKVWGL